MAGLNNNANPFQSQVRIGPNYIQLVPGPPGPPGTIALTGTGLVHVTSGSVDNAAYLGAAGSIPIVNAGGTDTAWLAIGTAGQVLTVVGGAPTWAAAPSGVAWADDLGTSTNAAQWVSGISGPNGTAGTVPLGDGANALMLGGNAMLSNIAGKFIQLQGYTGYSAPASAGNSGGLLILHGGIGGAGQGTDQPGGAAGQTSISGGDGGNSTGTANNTDGGRVNIVGGAPGTGGSGTAGNPGDIQFLTPTGTVRAFVTAKATGPGFGIGTTPGTDPTITRGTGVPATTQTDGSLFLRTDGSSGANALYAREGGVWYAVGGGGGTNATLTFEGQPFLLASAGSGNGAILWPSAQTTPSIGQPVVSTDRTPADLNISGQNALPLAATHLTGGNLIFTSGTGATTNGTPGNVVVNIPVPTGSGNEGHLQLQRAGSAFIDFGAPNTFGSAYAAIWFKQASPTISNYNFLGDGTNCYLQAASGGFVTLAIAGNGGTFAVNGTGQAQFFLSNVFASNGGINIIATAQTSSLPTSVSTSSVQWWANTGSPGSLGLMATGVQFHRLAGAIKISQDTATTDVATTGLTVQAQTAFAAATTNINGALLTLKGGNSYTGASPAKGGDVLILGGDTLSAGSATNGAKITLQTGTGTSPGDIEFNLGGTRLASLTSTPNVVANAEWLWDDNVVTANGAIFGFRAKTSDTATVAQTIQGQSAWPSATVNKTGGPAVLNGGLGVGGLGPASLACWGGGTSANAGRFIVQAPGGVGCSSGTTFSWTPATPAISATGTTTLSSSAYNCPFLHFTGTITGAVTVVFPNVPGFWLVDLSAMAGYSATNTISFQSGSTTKVVVNVPAGTTPLNSTNSIVVVVTNGSNTLYLLGSTAQGI